MANRSLVAKFERAQKQRREAAEREGSKMCFRQGKPASALTDGCKVVVLPSGAWDARSSLSINALRQKIGTDGGARRSQIGVRNGMRGRGVIVQVVDTTWEIYVRR
jgi:hypothetical protein